MRIIASSEEEKKAILEASEHIHYANIDTDIPMVNTLAHLYMYPEAVEVETEPTVFKMDD